MEKVKRGINPYHLVDVSAWPIVVSGGGFILTTGLVSYFGGNSIGVAVVGLGVICLGIGLWLRDIIREGTYEGQHTSMVQRGLRLGVILFIVSEVMFFFGFFWAFFYSSVSPVVEIGGVWPPKGIEVLDAWGIPLLNTGILVSSGASVTWAYHSIVVGDKSGALKGLVLTIVLAVIFTGLQGLEYTTAGFSINDGIYGSCFYMATGFHGFHVILGTIMLVVSCIRVWKNEVTRQHHFGFEASAYYWHFVDVVWLLLFVSIYWWGS